MKENNNEDKIQICSFPILLKYPRRQKKEMKTYNFLLLAGEVLLKFEGFQPLLPASEPGLDRVVELAVSPD